MSKKVMVGGSSCLFLGCPGDYRLIRLRIKRIACLVGAVLVVRLWRWRPASAPKSGVGPTRWNSLI